MRFDGGLAGAGTHHVAVHPEEIAQIKVLQHSVLVAQHVLPQHGLHHARRVAQIKKRRPSHHAHGNDSSGDADPVGAFRRLVRLPSLEQPDGFVGGAAALEPRRIGVDSTLPDTLQLGPAAIQVGLQAPGIFRRLVLDCFGRLAHVTFAGDITAPVEIAALSGNPWDFRWSGILRNRTVWSPRGSRRDPECCPPRGSRPLDGPRWRLQQTGERPNQPAPLP